MVTVGNEHVSLTFSAGDKKVPGIGLTAITDEVTGYQHLVDSNPRALFAYALDNGPLRRSDTDLVLSDTDLVLSEQPAWAGAALRFVATSQIPQERITFSVALRVNAGAPAVVTRLQVTSSAPVPVFLRLVLPAISGLVPPGGLTRRRGTVPKEIGCVTDLAGLLGGEHQLGMRLNLHLGLPMGMNALEVASIYDAQGEGGVFFADYDSDLEQGIAPVQLTLAESGVAGYWTTFLEPGRPVVVPGLAIGVHHGGDWHHAVDAYVTANRPRWTFPEIPAWFRDQGAIYTFSGGGAGGIYLDLPQIPSLSTGAVHAVWEVGDGAWGEQIGHCENPDGPSRRAGWPQGVTPAGLAPPGAPLAAVKQNDGQLDVFVTGVDGAVWVTWEAGDSAWRDGNDGRDPRPITPAGLAPPGAPLAAVKQNDGQLDVFVTGVDGAVWVTWEAGDSAWRDGNDGRDPRPITPAGLAPPGAPLAAVKQNDGQLDVFVTGVDGAVWVTWEAGDSAWRDGNDGRDPRPITPAGLAPPGAPLAVVKQNDGQLDVFVTGVDGAVWVTWEAGDSAWRDGNDGRDPRPITPAGLAPPGAPLAAVKQNDGQLDVFVTGVDGAVWVTWEAGDSAWRDGNDGRDPRPITPAGLAPPGAPLAVVKQNDGQLDVFVTGVDGAVWVTWEAGDSAWRDGNDGRDPRPITPAGFAPPGAAVTAAHQNEQQLDVFFVAQGLIRSFRDLPDLLKEAKGLGTDVLYLWDYWEGTADGGDRPYANKGDYRPRTDLGGAAAFVEGIRRVHDDGGRVLVYLEAFIVYWYSQVAREHAVDWAGYEGGALDRTYDRSYSMPAPSRPWQDYIVSVAERYVRDYDVDGIFLDSYAWQMNRHITSRLEPRQFTSLEFSQGVLHLTDRVRDAVRAIKPDAVVIGETTAGPIARHWDGGLSADFGFERAGQSAVLAGSPVRYAMPEAHWFSNGTDLNQLHQVYAAGHGLALCGNRPGGGFMHEHADHIRHLVDLRRTYGDALISGAQIYQPGTGTDAVIAYRYRGTQHDLMTVVNVDSVEFTIDLELSNQDRDTSWTDLTGPWTGTAVGTMLNGLAMPAEDVKVLLMGRR